MIHRHPSALPLRLRRTFAVAIALTGLFASCGFGTGGVIAAGGGGGGSTNAAATPAGLLVLDTKRSPARGDGDLDFVTNRNSPDLGSLVVLTQTAGQFTTGFELGCRASPTTSST